MDEWIVFEHDSGEIIFVKRGAITSFHPRYVHTRGYIIYATVGVESKPVHRSDTLEDARAWCEGEIRKIAGVKVKEKSREQL